MCTFQWKPQGTRTGPVWRLRARMVEHANQAYLNACAGWDTLGTTVNVRFISMHSNCRRSFIFKMRKKLKVCSVIDHRSRQNVLKTKKIGKIKRSRVCHRCSPSLFWCLLRSITIQTQGGMESTFSLINKNKE